MTSASPGLYQRTLADSWGKLDQVLRRFHDGARVVRAEGTFQVRHGTNWFTRLLAWLARLPAAGERVAIRLTILPKGDGEEWQRDFAGRPLPSRQWLHADGVLGELFGRTEVRLRLAVIDGALHYHPEQAALRLGPLRIPLFGWLRPRGWASETAVGPDQVRVHVEMNVPFFGRMVSYGGVVSLLGEG